jgi:hypothetical protein
MLMPASRNWQRAPRDSHNLLQRFVEMMQTNKRN